MSYRLDEVDRRVIHALMNDARNTAASDIAADLDVSPGTVRNRIDRLEDAGVIEGYHAAVDFEAAEGALANLYLCTAPVDERESLAGKVRALPEVINVRELMAGRRNVHVLAVGEDTATLRRVARDLSRLGLDIEDEDLVGNETFHPYTPYAPDQGPRDAVADFVSLAGGSEISEVAVDEGAPVAGLVLSEAVDKRLLDDDALVIALERDGTVITPHGDTEIRAGDLVTVFSRGGVHDGTLDAFRSRT